MLVGRAHELHQLDFALDRLGAGEPWLVEVVGEPGIGKTRLLLELARRAEARKYLVLGGRAAEFERDVPFGLIIEALNDYVGALESQLLGSLDELTARELAWIFPALSRLHGDLAPGRLDADRYRAQYAIRALLEQLASRQPLVLLLDDVHWADGASIDVIAHISRRFRGPLLAVLAFRQAPGRLARALDIAARGGFGNRLSLTPLTAAESGLLIGTGYDAGTQAALLHDSGGNPFYLEQLARSTRRQTPRPRGRQEDPPAPGGPPPAVAAAIRGEVETLDRRTRIMLDAAAVAGESFELELVAAIAQEPDPLTALDDLMGVDLIRGTDAPRRFRFWHPIVRRAVYDDMSRGWQLGAHARAAAALAAAGAPASARAHHVERSATVGDEEAIALLIDAARTAASRAPLTTGRWLRAALALLPARADQARRISLLTEAATALAAAGSYEESLLSFEEALALVPADQARERAQLSVRIADVKQHGLRRFESHGLLMQALESLPADSSTAQAVRLELAHDHFWRGEFREMRTLAASLATATKPSEPRAILAATLTSLADFYDGRIEDALGALAAAEQALAALSDVRLAERIMIPTQIGLAACRLERFDAAHEHVRRGARVSRNSGQNSIMPTLLRVEANALLMRGQLDAAVRVGDAATESALLSGHDRLAMWALEAAAFAAYWAGDTDGALANAREAAASAERTAEPFFCSLSRIQLAGAYLSGGDPTAARRELAALDADGTRRLLDLSAAHGWTLLIEAHLALGELEQAADVAMRAEARAEAAPLPQQTAGARYGRASVMLVQGDARNAVTGAQDAALRFETAGNGLFGARARVLAGAALGAAGERQAAVEELERADAVLSACGARQQAAAAARELRRLGRRVVRHRERAVSPAGSDQLSAREREVAHHVALGETNREVAAALFLSEKTIESHLARIYSKLGVHSRTALTAIIGREERGREAGPFGVR